MTMKFSRRHFIKLGGATAATIFGFGSFTFGQKTLLPAMIFRLKCLPIRYTVTAQIISENISARNFR